MCFVCAEQLRIAYGFQQMCDDSYRILLIQLEKQPEPVVPKEEPVIIDVDALGMSETEQDESEQKEIKQLETKHSVAKQNETKQIAPILSEVAKPIEPKLSVVAKQIEPKQNETKQIEPIQSGSKLNETRQDAPKQIEPKQIAMEPIVMGHDVIEQDAMEQDAMEQDFIEQDAMEQDGTEQYDTEQYDTEQYDTDQYDTDQYDTEQYDTEQYDTEQDDTEQDDTEQNGTEQNGMVLENGFISPSTSTAPMSSMSSDVRKSELSELLNEAEYLEEYLMADPEEPTEEQFPKPAPIGGATVAEAEDNNNGIEDDLQSIVVPGEDGIREIQNQCHVCGLILSKLAHLKRHMKAHAGTKPFKCNVCSKSFSRADNLRAHQRMHTAEKNYKCPLCDERFKRVDAAKAHMGSAHRDFVEANYHVCTVCDNFFKTDEKLIAHMELHRGVNRLVCDVCGKQFVGMMAYEAHLQRHAAESEQPTTYSCAHCDKKFSSKAYLLMHMRYMMANKCLECKYCGKSAYLFLACRNARAQSFNVSISFLFSFTEFARQSDLKSHEDYHTGIKPFTCKTCGKSFHRQCTLVVHMRTHTGEKPFQCSYCPKSFYQKNDMLTHERRHTGERYQCEFCEQKFIHLHLLNSHLKVVHNHDVDCRKRGVKKFFDEPGPTVFAAKEPKPE